jgi:lipooligosaccharide transport system ATP-binding protein
VTARAVAAEAGAERRTVLAVRARGLVKRYGANTAVAGIDLDVPQGRCFGVLGPNGAGKTTTIRMITCTSPPTAGSLEVLGVDVRGDRRGLKRRLGVVPQGMTLDDELTVRENLLTFAAYHGIARRVAASRADELLDFVQLRGRARDKVDDLSGGMQRRLLIARALVNDPDLVVLDEPTTGLDPQARQLVWERLRSLKRHGKTLLITTHYMEEAAQLCDRIVILHAGGIIAEGTPRELVERHVPPRVVEVTGADGGLIAVRRAVDAIRDTIEVEEMPDRVVLRGDDDAEILAHLRTPAIGQPTLVTRDATLEDVFLRLTGRALVD